MEKYDKLAKVLMIGDSGVGKTCILMRFVKDEHRIDHIPTLGKFPRSRRFFFSHDYGLRYDYCCRGPIGCF